MAVFARRQKSGVIRRHSVQQAQQTSLVVAHVEVKAKAVLSYGLIHRCL